MWRKSLENIGFSVAVGGDGQSKFKTLFVYATKHLARFLGDKKSRTSTGTTGHDELFALNRPGNVLNTS